MTSHLDERHRAALTTGHRDALRFLRETCEPNQVEHLPYEWPDYERWKKEWQPSEPSPIVALLIEWRIGAQRGRLGLIVKAERPFPGARNARYLSPVHGGRAVLQYRHRSCHSYLANKPMVTLPDVPEGKELEDFVAALLQCTRHFVEKNIQERDVLELDVVATSYAERSAEERLFEVKGDKDWGFSDIFKLLGHMKYLDICRGAFVTTRPPQDKDASFYRDRCQDVGIDLRIIEDIESARDEFKAAGYGAADELLHALWRYSFWVERRLIEILRQEAKAGQCTEAAREALRYYDLINNGVFLTRSVTERVEKLYEAYQDHPRLTLGAARQMSDQAFDPVTEGESELIGEALFDGKHDLLQACMYLEHRARLSILKGAVDYLCETSSHGDTPGSVTVDFALLRLPSSFLAALSTIQKEPYFWLYPLFWQVFLWGWGGLILTDREQDELGELSAQAGLPEECVAEALKAFDKLFPMRDGWLKEMSTASYRFVRMVPWPFCGIGAWQRLKRYKVDSYQELGLSGQFTANDLARRHNSCYALLKPV